MANTALENRYPLWFDQGIGFVGSTDEKAATTKAIKSVLCAIAEDAPSERPLLSGTRTIKLADLGCAAGILGKMVGDTVHAAVGGSIDYLGIDVNTHQKGAVLSNVVGESFHNVDFQLGSSEQLATFNPDVILASHIYYYPDNAVAKPECSKQYGTPLDSALRETVSSMKKDAIALIVHESYSDFDPVKRKYGAHVEADTTERLGAMLKPGVSSAASALSFESHIYFPHLDDGQWDRLKKAEHYEVGTNPYHEPKILNARILAEFMIHKPLENMSSTDRSDYIDELKHIVNARPLITDGQAAERFGPVHQMTNVNQLLIRTHHENKAAGEYVKRVVVNISQNVRAA